MQIALESALIDSECALTPCFLEAQNVHPAHSGGVHDFRDALQNRISLRFDRRRGRQNALVLNHSDAHQTKKS